MSYWENKVVVITGGSAGFGRELASMFASEKATVVLVARDTSRLETVCREIGVSAHAFPADVTDEDQVEQLQRRILSQFRKVDVLVNCVGKSARGAILDTSPEEFRELLELNFLTAVRCTRAFIGPLRDSSGHLVNIGSLAAKSASRFLGAYPASKFPLAAYSQQLRLELGEDPNCNVHVLLVCPGPIARQDSGMRYRQADVPAAARQPGGGVKLRGINPHMLARRVLSACERRELEVVVPAKARILFAVNQVSASVGDWLLRRMTRSK